MLSAPARLPRATYRLQLNRDFTFEQASQIVPYLADLGISEIYVSPFFQAASSSTHGYDVNDYTRVSADLGGLKGLEGLNTQLRGNGLGLLLDFVPNHMGIDGEFNTWWTDVLENGTASRFASFFDIEWHPQREQLQDRVLVPMLEGHYGTELEKGRFTLHLDRGRFFIHYGTLKLPIRPRSYGFILERVTNTLPSGDPHRKLLREHTEAFENLPYHDPEERTTRLINLRVDLARILDEEPVREALQIALDEINGAPGDPGSFTHLHQLLESQHYRLAHWKVGAHEVNYRRFFAIDTLVGLKMELPEVFDATHHVLGDLIGNGTVTGVRLDHIDGLWNPGEYLDRLAALVQEKRLQKDVVYTLAEKILAPGEILPEHWAVHGTTGYEFGASLVDLFLHPENERKWTETYGDFTGITEKSRILTYADKLFVIQEIFPNAIANLALELDSLIEQDWHWRDLSLHDLESALRYLIACFPVYRTYQKPNGEMSKSEQEWIHQALGEVIDHNPCLDPTPLRFVARVWAGEYPGSEASTEQRNAFARWVCKLQQFTGAIMAKSVEDTHFYRYVRMLGANEVGHHPAQFGRPVEDFHRANQERLIRAPFCLLATSTHDSKMSEDARARLFALAELPDDWRRHLFTWRDLNRDACSRVGDREAPDANEQYLFYQALLASWPFSGGSDDGEYRQRLKDYFRKAKAEAKLNTSWTYPHQEWDKAGERFIDAILNSPKLLEDFIPFAARVAERGMIFSLAQTVLKLTSPGVPDFYQGNEIWTFRLVDPDNRRPVDYSYCQALLTHLKQRSAGGLWENRRDGGIKMKVIQSILGTRARQPALFAEGSYEPLQVDGSRANQIVAYRRTWGNQQLLVVVPNRLAAADSSWLGTYWENTSIHLSGDKKWINLFSDTSLTNNHGTFALEKLFAEWPVAVLISL